MTESTQPEEQATDVNEVDYKAQVEDLAVQIDAIKAKNQELLNETKAAKAKTRAEADAAEQRKLEKAKKEGDFEQLLKSSEDQREQAMKELGTLRASIASEKVNAEALRIATELADGPKAEFLQGEVAKRLVYTDDGIKVTDTHQNLTVSSIEDLKNELVSSGKLDFLLRGNKSSGGGASGSGSGATGVKQMDRTSFDKMDATKKMAFMKDGGTLSD